MLCHPAFERRLLSSETFRFAPSFPLRYACGPLPLTCPRVGTGPVGDSRPHLRQDKNEEDPFGSLLKAVPFLKPLVEFNKLSFDFMC